MDGRPNEEITINLENKGSVDHEWVILQPGVTISNTIEGHAEAGITGTVHTPSSDAGDEDESA